MQTMTYGIMPSKDDFTAAFNRECSNGYKIELNSRDSNAVEEFNLGNGTWSCDDLWFALHEINDTDPGQFQNDAMMERALDLVSSILFTLGFEWV